MTERKYVPTLAELIDRMCICRLKAIFIPENKDAYEQEIADIAHDIDACFDAPSVSGEAIHAIIVNALVNREIWLNESKARQGSSEQNNLLRYTHSLNGVRNAAKNIISMELGERQDLKIDCLAADLPSDYGNWNIFGGKGNGKASE